MPRKTDSDCKQGRNMCEQLKKLIKIVEKLIDLVGSNEKF